MPAPGNDSSTALRWVGDRHLLVSFPAAPDLRARISAATAALTTRPPAGTLDIVPAESTILLTFDALTLDPASASAKAAAVVHAINIAHPSVPARTIDIPVCYDAAFAPDLAECARLTNLTPIQFTTAHAAAEHTVAFLGFAPGFPYISGLRIPLRLPRLASPRTRVPIGSIGIAADKTGIYPREGPGGWRLIGRTPLRMFDVARAEPALLRAGDRVRFVPINAAEFDRLAQEAR